MLWHAMAHLVNHGTQHRSEAAAMLTDFGHSPGDVDMLYFLNES
ncbi:MAG: DinB family protein [Anaerolineales bacterium]